MSVLIKGMEMPESCDECKLCSVDSSMIGYCHLLDEYSDSESTHIERQKNCPLIEVPTPHGKLIDKTKLKRDLFVNFMGERIPFYDCDNFPTTLTYIDLHSILSEQPTIIEAED